MSGLPPATVFSVTVPAEAAGGRLDRVLAEALPHLSRSRVQALLRDGHVSLVGGPAGAASRRVRPGEVYRIDLPPLLPAQPAAEDIPLAVVYEDEHLIVIDKPAGLVVHPGAGNRERTLVNALLAHCAGSLSGIGGVERPGIVHRLDKDTSGLMVAAKTDAAHRGLAEQFAAHVLERAYTAVAWGVPAPRQGSFSGNIGRSPRNRQKMAVLSRGGRTALTRYRVLRVLGGAPGPGIASVVECRLATGRTHQIRVHMAHAGHPLVGDPVYGGTRKAASLAGADGIGRQALHAHLIGFMHPISHEKLRFESSLPNDIKLLIDTLDGL